jgi:alginate O-acetyltransferase complex protein AlgI
MPVQALSGAYYVFIAILFFAYWLTAQSRLSRLAVLLFANYLFCARFGLFYVLLLPACATTDYLIGLGLTRTKRSAVRRLLLAVSVAMNLSLLLTPRLNHGILFPLGLSFYTFQALTYTIDLYRRDGECTHSLLEHLTAVSFFPSLQAGPISRVTDLVKQMSVRPFLSREDGGRAFFLIGTGLMKKVFIADFLAENYVNRIFDTPNLYSGFEVLIGVYAYSLQLYYDFSGYTDIARGTAQLLGIRLPINFDRPYAATNLAVFWRKWHISFSNWLRDYLYFSLPGKRTKVMPYIGLVITMLLGGLWHGISWTFAIWGLLHGVGLAITRWWQVHRGRPFPRPLGILATYHFVCFTWIFFRAGSVAAALSVLSRIGSLTPGAENVSGMLALVLLIALLALFIRKEWHDRAMEAFAAKPFYVHATALALISVAIQLLGGRGNAPFVYSRF